MGYTLNSMCGYQDYHYLTTAYREGYVRISHQEARVSLEKIGYITPAKVREKYILLHFSTLSNNEKKPYLTTRQWGISFILTSFVLALWVHFLIVPTLK
jgi:hypothetical protein